MARLCDDLVATAEILFAARQRAGGAPLRRAVSTAYYALFHCLAALCAAEMTRLPSTSNGYAFIYGLLDHRPTENALRSSDEFKDNLGGAFNGLLEARILSDYSGRLEPNSAISDGKGKLSRTKMRTLIDDAKKAIAFINALDQEARRRLVDTLVLRRKRK